MRCIALALALLLTAGLGAELLGLVNHNPGNIRAHSIKGWNGATGLDPWLYLQFQTDLDGLRAMRRVLRAYDRKHHLHTVAAICNRWVGPPRSNKDVVDHRDYILAVAQRLEVRENELIYLDDPTTLKAIARAIVYAENGMDPFSDRLYEQAFP